MANTECALNDGPNGSILIDCTAGGFDWLELTSAWGAVLSAVVALYVGYKSIKLSTQSEARVEVEKEASRAAEIRNQAERVSCWLEKHDSYPAYRIHVHNGSDQPVWEVSVLEPFNKNKEIRHFPVLRPGSEPVYAIEGLFTPGPEEQAVPITFRDNSGRTWMRTRLGALELVPEGAGANNRTTRTESSAIREDPGTVFPPAAQETGND